MYPHMLMVDEQTFKEEFSDAASFLLAASLRYECYTLYCRTYKSDWDKKRFKELLKCPACQKQWFKRLIKSEE